MSIHFRGAAGLIRWTALASLCFGLVARGATAPDDGGVPDISSALALSIHASPQSGPSPLHVHFEATFDGGAPPILRELWDFGQGQGGIGATADVDYPEAGRYHVSLLLLAADGVAVSADPVAITVTADGGEPPDCQAVVSPSADAGGAVVGQVVTWTNASTSVSSQSVHWTFSDGRASDQSPAALSFQNPGWVTGMLTVKGSNGLTCSDRASTFIHGDGGIPPLIVGGGNTRATCGHAYSYSSTGTAVAVGTGPLTWSADAPEGFEIDSKTGRVEWMPKVSEAGPRTIALEVSGPGGTDEQHFIVDVSCADVSLRTPFGCGTAGGATGFLPALLCLLAWSWVARKRSAQRTKRRA